MVEKELDKKCLLHILETKARVPENIVVDDYCVNDIYIFPRVDFNDLYGGHHYLISNVDSNYILSLLYEIESETKGRFSVYDPILKPYFSDSFPEEYESLVSEAFIVKYNSRIQSDNKKYELIYDRLDEALFSIDNPKVSLKIKGKFVIILLSLIEANYKYVHSDTLISASDSNVGVVSKTISRYRKYFTLKFGYLGNFIQSDQGLGYRLAKDIKIEIRDNTN